jgi:hypothetical protein
VLLIDGVCTLANVVIANLTQIDLVSWGCNNSSGSSEGWSLL